MLTNHATAGLTYSDIVALLTDDGWAPGAPSETADEIDRDVCAEADCSHCGRFGLAYHPWRNEDEQRYIAFAVCKSCNAVEEF